MNSLRLSRALALFVALFSMLFMQLAVASYACQGMRSSTIERVDINAPMAHAEMSHCIDMAAAQPGLCDVLAHSEAAKQSADNVQLPDVPSFVAVELVQALHLIENFPAFSATPLAVVSLSRSTAPPVAIRHCCFRI